MEIGKRTLTAVLRIMGLSQQVQVNTFFRTGPVVIGIDETIEHRRGQQITARGIYRDPVRSSNRHFVKASGLLWVSLMLLINIPWAAKIWALPFLTVLAPSERYYAKGVHQPKKLTDWARQMGIQVRRWLPKCNIVLVADSTYAPLGLLDSLVSLSEPV